MGWWATQPVLSQQDQQHLPELLDWLDDHVLILKATIPKRSRCIADMEEQGRWLPAAELTTTVVAAYERCRADMQAWAESGQELTEQQARWVHDVCLAVLLWGYLPPVRLTCIAQLTFKGQGCLHVDCELAREGRCLGNRVQQEGSNCYSIRLPHHKTQHHRGNAIVFARLPAEVNWVLSAYLQVARPRLCQIWKKDPTTCFMTKTGHGFDRNASHFSTYFQKQCLPAIGLNTASFPPRTLRHIFVVDRMSAPAGAPGPSHAGAALCMGNSVRAWERHYHLNNDVAEVQRAVDDMPAWRESMLAQAAQLNT